MNDGGPAFPGGTVLTELSQERGCPIYPGMSVRQWYKGMAMAGMLAANPDGLRESRSADPIYDLTAASAAMADAQLAEDQMFADTISDERTE